MLEWLASSGGRPKSDPPTGLAVGDSDQEDDGTNNYGKALGRVRSRRGRKQQHRGGIQLRRTISCTESDTASEEDHAKPVPEVFHFFDEDDVSRLSNMYELDGCGSMLYEAMAIRPQYAPQRRTSKSDAKPWQKLLPSSKLREDPDGMSPRKKLLKRMNGSVNAESTSLRRREAIDPVPSEPHLHSGNDFDDQVLQSAMDIVAKNRSIKHHSSIKRLLSASESSDTTVPSHRQGRNSRERRDPVLSPLNGDTAIGPRGKKKNYTVDSDNSILHFTQPSDVESSDVSLFQTIQRALQIQRSGRPSPPASPLREARSRVEGTPSMSLYAAINSTLDDDPIIESRTPPNRTPNDHRRCPSRDQPQLPPSGTKVFRRKPDATSPPRKRRIARRLQVARFKHADEDSLSDESPAANKYTSTWHKKQRVVSPTHSIASQTMDTRPVPNRASRALPSRTRGGGRSSRPAFHDGLTAIETERPLGRESAGVTTTSECWGANPMSSLPPSTIWRSEMLSVARAARMNPRLPDCWKYNREPRTKFERTDRVLVNDCDDNESSKAVIQARRRMGLRIGSLADDSSGFVTTDEEENGARQGGSERRVSANRKDPAKPSSGKSVLNISPEVLHTDRSRRLLTPLPSCEVRVNQAKTGNGAEKDDENDIPSPVHSVGEPELELISFLSGDCGGEAVVSQEPGMKYVRAKGDTADCWSPGRHSGWSFFHQSDSRARDILNSVRDESRHSPLLVSQHRRPTKPPRPEKRKSRDCRPDLNLSGNQRIDTPAKEGSSYFGDCDILSVVSRDSHCEEKDKLKNTMTHRTLSHLPLGQNPRSSKPPKPEKGRNSERYQSESHRSIHFDRLAEKTKLKAGMTTSGGRENPIIIGDQVVSMKSKLCKDNVAGTVEHRCHLLTSISGECAHWTSNRRLSLVVDPLQPGGSRNPIVITDANAAIHEVLGDEKPVLHASAEENRRHADFDMSIVIPQIVEDVTITSVDGSSDCENRPMAQLTNDAHTWSRKHHASTLFPPPNDCDHPTFIDEINDQELKAHRRAPKNRLLEDQGSHQREADNGSHKNPQVQPCMRSHAPIHGEANCRYPVISWKRIVGQDHLMDDCPVKVCGVRHDQDNRSSVVHSSEHLNKKITLQAELERQLGTSNGVVLFKPTICIYSKGSSQETHSRTFCGTLMPTVDTSALDPTFGGDTLDQVSATIARLEEKALHVDHVLTRALELVEKKIFVERDSAPVEDDDGMGEEIDRLSRSETALRKELSDVPNFSPSECFPCANSVVSPGRSKLSTSHGSHVKSHVTQPALTSRYLGKSTGSTPKTSNRLNLSEGLVSVPTATNIPGVSARFPVDLTHEGDTRSIATTDLNAQSNASSAESDVTPKDIATLRDESRVEKDYMYDAVPPMQRLRDQARKTKRETNDRVSSILHLVGPNPAVYCSNHFENMQDDQSDFAVDPNILVLHHRNQDDVEIVCLTEGDRESDESTEEIEVVFVEESFLSTDSFSFGEMKGVYFDWKRSRDDSVAKATVQRGVQGTRPDVVRHHAPTLREKPLKYDSTGTRGRDKWRPKAAGAIAEKAVERCGERAPEPSSPKFGQEELVDKVIHIPVTPAVVGSRRVSLSDPPESRSFDRRLASPHSSAIQRNYETLEARSGVFSDVFSGLEDSVKQDSRNDDESSGSLKRRVEAITRRSERSKRSDVVLLESGLHREPKQEGLDPSIVSSSMMDDDEESLLSLTLSITSKESINSNTCLLSVASTDAESKLKDLLARGKKLVQSNSTSRSMAVQEPKQGEIEREHVQQGSARPSTTGLPELKQGAVKRLDEPSLSSNTLRRGVPECMRTHESNSIDELSEWDSQSSQAPDVSAAFKSPPAELVAEIRHLEIPKNACKISSKPPIGTCPASRRLLRLRRLQDNWKISKRGHVIPKQGHTKLPETKPPVKGRFRCAMKRFSKVASSNVTVDSCSTLTPSVRRYGDPATSHLGAMRISRLLARERNFASRDDAPSRNVVPNATDTPNYCPSHFHTTSRKAMLGYRHISKELSTATQKLTVSPALTPKAPKSREPDQGHTFASTHPIGSPISRISLSKLMKKLSPSSYSPRKKISLCSPRSHVQHRDIQMSGAGQEVEKQRDSITAPLSSPHPTCTNPFESRLGENAEASPTIFFPEECLENHPVFAVDTVMGRKKRLHLSSIPDFPDLLHPSLRRVLSYPPMRNDSSLDATPYISSTKSASPRSLKGLLPPFVRSRNAIAALPGSLLWEATHESSDEEL